MSTLIQTRDFELGEDGVQIQQQTIIILGCWNSPLQPGDILSCAGTTTEDLVLAWRAISRSVRHATTPA